MLKHRGYSSFTQVAFYKLCQQLCPVCDFSIGVVPSSLYFNYGISSQWSGRQSKRQPWIDQNGCRSTDFKPLHKLFYLEVGPSCWKNSSILVTVAKWRIFVGILGRLVPERYLMSYPCVNFATVFGDNEGTDLTRDHVSFGTATR